MPMNQELSRELLAVGARPNIQLNTVVSGPFVFTGVHTDNTLTPADLTLSANIPDSAIRFAAGAVDNPQFIVQIEAVELVIDCNTESAAIQKALLDAIALRHVGPGVLERRHSLGPFSTALMGAGGLSPAAGGVLQQNTARFGPKRFDEPWIVDLNTDTFEMLPTVLVNTVAATTPFSLHVYGAGWAKTGNGLCQPKTIRCMSEDTAKKLRAIQGAAGNIASRFR